MTPRYMLLNALIPQDFGLTVDELKEAVEEFGCSLVISEGLRDPGSTPATQFYYFITGPSLEAMTQMVNNVDLSGVVVRYDEIHDQEEHITKIVK